MGDAKTCVFCNATLGEKFYGQGDGSGERFACPECHWRWEANEKDGDLAALRAKVATLKKQLALAKRAAEVEKAAADIFEKNSADATAVWEENRALKAEVATLTKRAEEAGAQNIELLGRMAKAAEFRDGALKQADVLEAQVATLTQGRDEARAALGRIEAYHAHMVHGDDCPRRYHEADVPGSECSECDEGETCPECECCLGVVEQAALASDSSPTPRDVAAASAALPRTRVVTGPTGDLTKCPICKGSGVAQITSGPGVVVDGFPCPRCESPPTPRGVCEVDHGPAMALEAIRIAGVAETCAKLRQAVPDPVPAFATYNEGSPSPRETCGAIGLIANLPCVLWRGHEGLHQDDYAMTWGPATTAPSPTQPGPETACRTCRGRGVVFSLDCDQTALTESCPACDAGPETEGER